MERVNLIKVWVKHHGEVPLNNEYTLKKLEDRNIKQVLFGGGY
jgi:hypothetical protein